MILCLSCGQPLDVQSHRLACLACGFHSTNDDGIVRLVPPTPESDVMYDPDEFDALAAAEESHFWFAARSKTLLSLVKRHVYRENKIFEIGPGTGAIAKSLISAGYSVAVGDVHYQSLAYANKNGIKERYQFDLRTSPFVDHFNVATLFDVLEHIDDDANAVRQLHRMLTPGGAVIASVPAQPWLWSPFDQEARHRRRYSARALKDLFVTNGFSIVEIRGLFPLLIPAFILRKMGKARTGLHSTHTGNIIGSAVMSLDSCISDHWKSTLGTSLCIVARKH